MREVLAGIREWYDQGLPFALATVVDVRGSVSRPLGAAMAMDANGRVVGSVSGGCVESAVHEVGQTVLRTGLPRLETYQAVDGDAFAIGPICGGSIDVLVQYVDPGTLPVEFLDTLAARQSVAIATVVGGPAALGSRLYVWPDRVAGSLGDETLDAAIAACVRGGSAEIAEGVARVQRYCTDRTSGPVTVFVQAFAPPPRMLVFGASDFALALTRVGRFLGYGVTVCDARPVFATPERFPDAEVICQWPHSYLADTEIDERTVLCVLTHDPKFDIPLLRTALRTQVAYIGVMGSRRAHADRLARLRAEGVTDAELARLAAPIGLDLGASTPEEVAISIAAELITTRTGATGGSLSNLSGPIHGSTELSWSRSPA